MKYDTGYTSDPSNMSCSVRITKKEGKVNSKGETSEKKQLISPASDFHVTSSSTHLNECIEEFKNLQVSDIQTTGTTGTTTLTTICVYMRS